MRKTRVEFQGEIGIDSGGLSQEWYLLLSRELLKPSYCLFVKQQGETYHVDARSQLNDEHISYFRFAGQILAKAILDRKIVGMHLSRALLKVGFSAERMVCRPLSLSLTALVSLFIPLCVWISLSLSLLPPHIPGHTYFWTTRHSSANLSRSMTSKVQIRCIIRA